ncbi:MAG: Carbon monoxide dehydrogenase [Burkholderia sp.]|nr:Carbon monoxide dehydrogenase [Burkholderia sp.]
MYPFKYRKADSVADAAAALAANSEAKLLAGGQTLIASLKLRLNDPSQLVDLGELAELSGIKLSRNKVSIGAMTRHAQVAASREVKQAIPALAYLAASIGDRMVRTMGTIGGSIANNDPAADYPASVVGLGATVVTNQREIDADDFFRGMFETALMPGEIITRVDFPIPRRAAYIKFKNQASRFAIVGLFVVDAGTGVRVAVTGAAPCVFRVPEMEKALAARFAPESVANVTIDPSNLNSDLHASAEYRAHLITIMAKRAVHAAMNSAAEFS